MLGLKLYVFEIHVKFILCLEDTRNSRRSKFSFWYLDTVCAEKGRSMFLGTACWHLTGLEVNVTTEGYCVMYTDTRWRNFRWTLQNLNRHKVP